MCLPEKAQLDCAGGRILFFLRPAQQVTEVISQIQRELRALSDPQKAELFKRFFKTGPGQYGEGDVFLGVTVPQTRRLARKYKDISLGDISKLLKSKFHEERLLALIILTEQFQRSEPSQQKKIYSFYLKNKKFANNWDLIDGSSPAIVGGYLFEKERKKLYQLAQSKSLWDRRIAILATFYFIRQSDLDDTFALAEVLLKDQEDLIHKAVGWMLREAGKRDIKKLRDFLRANAPDMPRTMLRYAIEKLDAKERQRFMRLKSASRI